MKVTGIAVTKGFFTLPIFFHTIDTDIPTALLPKIINYLKNGHLLFPFMGYVYNDKGDAIAQDSFLTDGQWIWHKYYTYFIENSIFSKIEKRFLDYIILRKFEIPSIPDSDLRLSYNDFENLLDNNIDCDETELRRQRNLKRGF